MYLHRATTLSASGFLPTMIPSSILSQSDAVKPKRPVAPTVFLGFLSMNKGHADKLHSIESVLETHLLAKRALAFASQSSSVLPSYEGFPRECPQIKADPDRFLVHAHINFLIHVSPANTRPTINALRPITARSSPSSGTALPATTVQSAPRAHHLDQNSSVGKCD